MADVISSDEFAQYDRQIRLWGLEAQKRLRQADVLVIGVGGLGSEVIKNIVLAGIRSITLADSKVTTEEDLASQLLITPDHLGLNIAEASQARTQELNPNVNVAVDTENLALKDDEYFHQFNVVCMTRCSETLKVKLNVICRKKGIKFFCGDVFGFFGYFFSDLGTHEYAVEVPVKKTQNPSSEGPAAKKAKVEEEMVTVKRTSEFCSYEEAMKEDMAKRNRKELRNTSQVFFIMKILDRFQSEHDRLPLPSDADILNSIKTDILAKSGMKDSFVNEQFATFCCSQLSPVAAIVGGVLGQEVIKIISKKDQPHNNFFFFDGLKHVGIVDKIQPK